MMYMLFIWITMFFLPLQSAQLTDLDADCVRTIAYFTYPMTNHTQEVVKRLVGQNVDNNKKSDIEKLNELMNCCFAVPDFMYVNKFIHAALINKYSPKKVYEDVWSIVSKAPPSTLKSFLKHNYEEKIEGEDDFYGILYACNDSNMLQQLKIRSQQAVWIVQPFNILDHNLTNTLHPNTLHTIFSHGVDPRGYNNSFVCRDLCELYFSPPLDQDYHAIPCKRFIQLYDFPTLVSMSKCLFNYVKGKQWPSLLCMLNKREQKKDWHLDPCVTKSGFQRILYQRKKSINEVDQYGRTFLSYALDFPFKDPELKEYVLELLLETGASVDLLSHDEQNRITTELASIFEPHRLEKSLHIVITNVLISAGTIDDPERQRAINLISIEDCLRRGANPNTVINGKNPIELVLFTNPEAVYCKEKILNLLVDYGAVEYRAIPQYGSENLPLQKVQLKNIESKTGSGVRLSYDPQLRVMKLLGIFKQPF